MINTNKVKNFKDFSSTMKRSRKFNRIYIEGEIKGGFLSKSIPFEIIVYFTNVKKIIFNIYSEGIDIKDKRLKLSFKIGDHIDLAKQWVMDNGYKITFEKNN